MQMNELYKSAFSSPSQKRNSTSEYELVSIYKFKGFIGLLDDKIEEERQKLDWLLKLEHKIKEEWYDDDTEARILYEYVRRPMSQANHEIEKYKRIQKIARPPKKGMERITQEDIERARAHPITAFLTFDNRGSDIICPFHSEKTPSLHLYKKQNKVHCFGGCGSFDSIAIYMYLKSCDFLTAVKELC